MNTYVVDVFQVTLDVINDFRPVFGRVFRDRRVLGRHFFFIRRTIHQFYTDTEFFIYAFRLQEECKTIELVGIDRDLIFAGVVQNTCRRDLVFHADGVKIVFVCTECNRTEVFRFYDFHFHFFFVGSRRSGRRRAFPVRLRFFVRSYGNVTVFHLIRVFDLGDLYPRFILERSGHLVVFFDREVVKERAADHIGRFVRAGTERHFERQLTLRKLAALYVKRDLFPLSEDSGLFFTQITCSRQFHGRRGDLVDAFPVGVFLFVIRFGLIVGIKFGSVFVHFFYQSVVRLDVVFTFVLIESSDRILNSFRLIRIGKLVFVVDQIGIIEFLT